MGGIQINEQAAGHFEAEGYLLPVDILTAEEVAEYRAVFEKLQAEHEASGKGGRLTNRHLDVAKIYELATHPKVIEAAAACFGPDLVLISSGFFYKKPDKSGGFVAWHQDTTYWGLRPPKAVTVWIALYESDVENGCMRIVPRTHRVGLLPHGKSGDDKNLLGHDQAIDIAHFDESTAVDCILKPGQASVHHGELVHGSNANTSDRPRCGMTVRFTTPDVQPIVEGDFAFKEKPVLTSGEDRFGYFNYVKPEFTSRAVIAA